MDYLHFGNGSFLCLIDHYIDTIVFFSIEPNTYIHLCEGQSENKTGTIGSKTKEQANIEHCAHTWWSFEQYIYRLNVKFSDLKFKLQQKKRSIFYFCIIRKKIIK